NRSVVTPHSSTNTYCAASWSGIVSTHCRRAAATSGRRCSSACTVFFEGQSQAIDLQPERAERGRRRQCVPELRQGRIWARVDESFQPLFLARQDPRPKLHVRSRRDRPRFTLPL